MCKSYPIQSALQYSNANTCCAPIYFKRETAKKQQKGPQFISRIYHFNITPLKVLPLHAGIVLAIYSLCKLQPIRNTGAENQNRGHKSDLTCTVLNTFHDILPEGNSCVCVCVEEENEKSYTEGTGFRGQINNGLLTATLLPVICMQRSAEKVNVQKDTNSTIISRPENTLRHTLRH